MFDLTYLHPIVVHFTIGLFVLSVLFDILGAITKKEKFKIAGWLNLLFAGAAGIVTVIAGLIAESRVPHVEAAHEIMETHETLGFITLGSILLLLVWRLFLKGKLPQKALALYLFIGIAGLGVMFTGAYYGGEMVYTYGVAVKAVPVSEEAGHHHEGDNAHEEKPGIEKMRQDSGKVKILPKEEQKGHKHKDGSEHVH